MRGRVTFVYSTWTVDAIGRIRAVNLYVPSNGPSTLVPAVIDQIFVENRDFYPTNATLVCVLSDASFAIIVKETATPLTDGCNNNRMVQLSPFD